MATGQEALTDDADYRSIRSANNFRLTGNSLNTKEIKAYPLDEVDF